MSRKGTGGDPGLTSFVGRRRELSAGRRLLGGARLVTLVGPGGVGKTRLARRLADEAARAFPDGTFLVELAELHDRESLVDEVVSSLGVEDIGPSPEAAVAAFVRDRELLLVLDNCEHVVEAAARLAHGLLGASSGLRIVATSRQPIGVAGEQLMVVEPLALPAPAPAQDAGPTGSEAVDLFVERARLVAPGFTLTSDNADLVGRVCRTLDGMPLAIELAAARLRVLSLPQLLERLQDRFGLLAAASPTALPRHQTLRASVDWSFDLCSAEEQRLWAWLSIFDGGCDLDAVEAVCADSSINVFDTVAGLVDKSVLTPHETAGRVRYWMLDTIRAYGRGRLTEQETELLVERHRRYFVEVARSAGAAWFGPDQRDLLARAKAEHANLRAAFEACLASEDARSDALVMVTFLWWYWLGVGAIDEATRWFARALALPHEPDTTTLSALATATWIQRVKGDREAVAAYAERGLALLLDESDDQVAADRRLCRAQLAANQGDLERAIAEDRAGLLHEAQLDRLGAEERVGVLVSLIVRLSSVGGDAEALVHIEEATQLCRQHGDEWYLSFLFFCKGRALAHLGRPHDALDAQREALRLGRGAFHSFTVVQALESVAQLFASLEDAHSAAVLYGALSGLWPAIGAPSLEEYETRRARTDPRTRELLGETAFAAAFERGRRMTVERAVSFVLGEPRRQPAEQPSAELEAMGNLTKRELEVAELVARGLSNKEIARALVLSPRTAEGHVARLLDKLGFDSRARVAAWVAERRAGNPTGGRS